MKGLIFSETKTISASTTTEGRIIHDFSGLPSSVMFELRIDTPNDGCKILDADGDSMASIRQHEKRYFCGAFLTDGEYAPWKIKALSATTSVDFTVELRYFHPDN